MTSLSLSEPGRKSYLMAQLRGKNVSWIYRLPPGGDARVLRAQAFVHQLPALLTGYVTVTIRQGLLGFWEEVTAFLHSSGKDSELSISHLLITKPNQWPTL